MMKKKTKRKSKTESLLDEVNNRRIDLTPEQVDTIITERGLVFIDPLSDFGFKRLLGMERTKDITIHLLNTFMSDDTGVITDITFISSEQVGLLPGKKKVRLDIHCKTQNGDHIIIEMQRERQLFFVRRLRAYHSHSTISGVKIGDTVYATVPKVFSISFMEKDMPEFKGKSRFLWKVYPKDDDNEIFSKENVWYFVELCKFAAQLETLDLTHGKNRWLYMLTRMADISKDEVQRMDPVYQRFYEECRISNLNEMEKKEYVTSVLEYDDVRESMMCEREEGREEGRQEERRQLAVNMLSKGFDSAVIAEITSLSENEVLALVER